MYVIYNGYEHANNSLSLRIESLPIRSPTEVRYGLRQRWYLTGQLYIGDGETSADLANKIALLKNAYAVDGLDITFRYDNGDIAEYIDNEQTMSGVRVLVAPSLSPDRGAEYATRWPYRIVVEGEVRTDAGNTILQFQEEITVMGDGGPLTAIIPTVTGSWVKQRVTQAGDFRSLQQGVAVGLTDWPVPNAPLWPSDLEQRPMPLVKRRSPRIRLGGYYEFQTQWRYSYHAIKKLDNNPATDY